MYPVRRGSTPNDEDGGFFVLRDRRSKTGGWFGDGGSSSKIVGQDSRASRRASPSAAAVYVYVYAYAYVCVYIYICIGIRYMYMYMYMSMAMSMSMSFKHAVCMVWSYWLTSCVLF